MRAEIFRGIKSKVESKYNESPGTLNIWVGVICTCGGGGGDCAV